MLPTEYRPCVVAVFTNSEGKVLLGKRSDIKDVWQFPQGGIEPGEGALTALYREMLEEVGCDRFKVIANSKSEIKYRFPEQLTGKIAKRWIGQTQVWFHVVFDVGFAPSLGDADDEFEDFEWFDVEEAIRLAVDWKRDCYISGLTQLGLFNK